MKESGYAYEAKDLKGDLILVGEPSSLSTSYPATFQDAIVEVAIKARDLGFRLILFVRVAKGLNKFVMEEVNQDCRNNL